MQKVSAKNQCNKNQCRKVVFGGWSRQLRTKIFSFLRLPLFFPLRTKMKGIRHMRHRVIYFSARSFARKGHLIAPSIQWLARSLTCLPARWPVSLWESDLWIDRVGFRPFLPLVPASPPFESSMFLSGCKCICAFFFAILPSFAVFAVLVPSFANLRPMPTSGHSSLWVEWALDWHMTRSHKHTSGQSSLWIESTLDWDLRWAHLRPDLTTG